MRTLFLISSVLSRRIHVMGITGLIVLFCLFLGGYPRVDSYLHMYTSDLKLNFICRSGTQNNAATQFVRPRGMQLIISR